MESSSPTSSASSGSRLNNDTEAVLAALRQDLNVEIGNACFACGGSIKIVSPPQVTDGNTSQFEEYRKQVDNQQIRSNPVTIRYGPSGSGKVLILPVAEVDSDDAFQSLLRMCQPATFGRGSEDVYDKAYREAVKLDPSEFCTDFCPYESGIIDVVAQLLLPACTDQRGVRAELYKLNMYSGPSGKFKAHVDTPRGEDHIGSLVVALPLAFEGGQLAVSYGDRELEFDWSASLQSKPEIKWAAFYSDCAHEVLTVTSGHRLTLTYNLFSTHGSGSLAVVPKSLDPTTLPLYHTLSEALSAPSFFRKGGTLGFYLNHSYPHASKPRHHNLPAALKGTDMILYQLVKTLKLPASLVPVFDEMDDDMNDYYDEQVECVYREKLEPFSGFDEGEQEDPVSRVMMNWGISAKPGEIHWVTRKKHDEMQLAYMAYGNQAELDFAYTSVALFVDIPAFAKRNTSADAAVTPAAQE